MLQALLVNWYFPPASAAAFAGVLRRGRFFAGRRLAYGAMCRLCRRIEGWIPGGMAQASDSGESGP